MKANARRRVPVKPKPVDVPRPRRGVLPGWGETAFLATLLASFAFLVIGRRIGLPFVGDDYVFLDKTRASSFVKLWSPVTSVDSGGTGPWSRELHFWVIQRLFGVSAAASA